MMEAQKGVNSAKRSHCLLSTGVPFRREGADEIDAGANTLQGHSLRRRRRRRRGGASVSDGNQISPTVRVGGQYLVNPPVREIRKALTES